MSLGLKPKLQPDDYTCNFASLHTAGRYYGIDVQEDVFRNNIKSLTYELGATGEDLADVTRHFGLSARLQDNTTYHQLEYLVEEKKVPVIVEVWDGGREAISDGHFVTVDKVKEDSIRYADPCHRKIQEVEKEDFLRNWFTFDVHCLKDSSQLTLRRMIAVTMPGHDHEIFDSKYLALREVEDRIYSYRQIAVSRMTAAASLGRFFRSRGTNITNTVIDSILYGTDVEPDDLCNVARALNFESYDVEDATHDILEGLVKHNPGTEVIVEWWDGNPLLKNFRHFSLVKDIFTWEEDGHEYISFYDTTRRGVQEARWHDFERNWFGFEDPFLEDKNDLHLRRMVVLNSDRG
jgi:predicted double-glycine peptidase